MAVSAHHTPTPSLAIWRRFSVPHPLSLCRFQLVTFLLPLCFLFLLLFKCQESQPVEEVMHGKARLLELSLGQERKGPFALEVGAESTSTWTLLCFAKPCGAKIQPPVWESAQLLADSRLRGVDGGQDLTWDFLKTGAESLVVVRCLLSRHQVYFSRKRTVELQNCPHGRVWNWSGICRVCTPCRFFKSQERPIWLKGRMPWNSFWEEGEG